MDSEEIIIGMIEKVDQKVDLALEKLEGLLVREGEREGETRATRRFALIAATIIPMIIGVAGIVIAYNSVG